MTDCTVKDFIPLVQSILRTHGLEYLVPAIGNVEFMRTKLADLEHMYRIRSIDFTLLKWVQDYYRS